MTPGVAALGTEAVARIVTGRRILIGGEGK
jgi:hypothetical protein